MTAFVAAGSATASTAQHPTTTGTSAITTTLLTTTTMPSIQSQIDDWYASQAGSDLKSMMSSEAVVAADLSVLDTPLQVEIQACTNLEDNVQTLSNNPSFPDPSANTDMLNVMADDMIAAQACVNTAISGVNAVYDSEIYTAINTGGQDWQLFLDRLKALFPSALPSGS